VDGLKYETAAEAALEPPLANYSQVNDDRHPKSAD
jgi:hypothetical protein